MILRRITEHVKAQNWTAVGLDFVIVVVGVFIGIQVANWNDSRAFTDREQQLLKELRAEIVVNAADAAAKADNYRVAGEAGRRALAFLESGENCEDECWPLIVDFMHASQWQQVAITRTIYDELRRAGLPQDRAIVELVEAFHAESQQTFNALRDSPQYRTLVRRLIPVALQDAYWSECYSIDGGIEIYVDPCPQSVSDEEAQAAIAGVSAHPEIFPTLTEWAGYTPTIANILGSQNTAADRVIEAIDAELAKS
ncbi:MAG: hypothetical protein AAF583_04120 [Pseudomonadota bacterium]